MTLQEEIRQIGANAKNAALILAGESGAKRSNAVLAMADAIERHKTAILDANAIDLSNAKEAGLTDAMIDRLTLTDARFKSMVEGVRQVAALPDPLTHRLAKIHRPNGLEITKKPVPIGVVAIIFESRPNVTADAAALCLKSGNSAILRGGKEAIATNKAIADAIIQGLAKAKMPNGTIQLIRTTDRSAVGELVSLDEYVDVVIPRGGESLIRAVVEQARVPVLKHYNGICHIFVDESADQNAAIEIIKNAKCQRPGTCNAVEKVLVHASIAEEFIPRLANEAEKWGVEIRADEMALSYAPSLTPATEEDWKQEYLAKIFTLGVVPNVKAAIEHINFYGSHHSDAILTSSKANARRFTTYVDSAAVYVNASTRFTDGGEFGFGCEMGISTDKLHARGPVGIKELTTYKYVIQGNGHIRASS